MPELRVRIGCVVLAVIMSAVTYYFVEPRLRWGRYGGYKAAGLLSVMVAVGIAGYSIERHDGYTARMNDPEQPVIDAINSRLKEDNERCLKLFPEWKTLADVGVYDVTQCKFQKSPGENTIAIIGDSHAGHLYPGLISLTKQDEGVIVFPGSGSIPLIGLHSFPTVRPHTERLLSKGFDYILSHKNITKVVLSHHPGGSWNNVIDTKNLNNHDFQSILHDGFVRTFETLTKAGKEIYVVIDNPEYDNNHFLKCNSSIVRRPFILPGFLSSKKPDSCSLKSSQRPDRVAVDNWNKVAHELSSDYTNIHFIDLEYVFCPNELCSMLGPKGDMLYMDAGHLNVKGSIYAAPFILEHLRQ